jgi:Na+-driven multidrug efflux pump
VFRQAIAYGAGLALLLGLLAAVFAGPLIGIFTQDPSVTAYTQSYLWIVALSYGFLAAMMIEANAFQAIGRSWPGFWILILKFGVVSLPAGYILTVVLGYPIHALWGAVAAGNVAASIVGFFWIRSAMRHVDFKEIAETVHTHG